MIDVFADAQQKISNYIQEITEVVDNANCLFRKFDVKFKAMNAIENNSERYAAIRQLLGTMNIQLQLSIENRPRIFKAMEQEDFMLAVKLLTETKSYVKSAKENFEEFEKLLGEPLVVFR